MQLLATLAFFGGVIAYSVASTLFFLELFRPSDVRRALGPRALGVGAGFHAAHVVSASLFSNICPVESLHFALSFSALVAASVYLLWRQRLRLDALGVLIAPLCLAFLVGAEFVGSSERVPSEVPRSLLVFHIAANVLGTGLFLLAGTAGAFYVFEERRLKQKKLGVASRLPSLAALDRAAHRLLLAGFPLLTLGVVTGSVFLDKLATVDGPELVRSVLGYASWLLLALVLTLRRLRGWSGRSAAYGTLAGVGGVLIVVLFYVFRVAS